MRLRWPKNKIPENKKGLSSGVLNIYYRIKGQNLCRFIFMISLNVGLVFSLIAEEFDVEHCENRPNLGQNPARTTVLADEYVCDSAEGHK